MRVSQFVISSGGSLETFKHRSRRVGVIKVAYCDRKKHVSADIEFQLANQDVMGLRSQFVTSKLAGVVMKQTITVETIENKIYPIRGQKVMLDKHLALLYGVTTKSLNKGGKAKDRVPGQKKSGALYGFRYLLRKRIIHDNSMEY